MMKIDIVILKIFYKLKTFIFNIGALSFPKLREILINAISNNLIEESSNFILYFFSIGDLF